MVKPSKRKQVSKLCPWHVVKVVSALTFQA